MFASRHRRRLRRLHDERGSVLPVAMGVIAIVLLLGGVAMGQSGFVSDRANEDRRVKRALQAADAGIAMAVYRMNVMDTSRQSSTSKCVRVNTSSTLELTGYVTVNGAQWCPQVTESLGDGAAVSYYVSPETTATSGGVSVVRRTVVATGTVGGVPRRVAIDSEAPIAAPLFGEWTVSSRLGFNMNSSAQIFGSVRSNQGISLNSSARVNCLSNGTMGDAIPGPGFTTTTQSSSYVCDQRAPATQPFTLAPVNADVASTNDNWRICNSSATPPGDPCTSRSAISWDATTRELALNSSSTVTLGGSIYSFCSLQLDSSSRIIIPPKAAGSSVRIYIDRPEDCTGIPVNNSNGQPQRGSMYMNSSTTITNQNADPTTLQIYVQGSTAIPTYVGLNSSVDLPMSTLIYAPESIVSLQSSVRMVGAIAAKQVSMDSSTRLTFDSRALDVSTDGVFPLLRRQQYRECTPAAAAGASPSSSC